MANWDWGKVQDSWGDWLNSGADLNIGNMTYKPLGNGSVQVINPKGLAWKDKTVNTRGWTGQQIWNDPLIGQAWKQGIQPTVGVVNTTFDNRGGSYPNSGYRPYVPRSNNTYTGLTYGNTPGVGGADQNGVARPTVTGTMPPTPETVKYNGYDFTLGPDGQFYKADGSPTGFWKGTGNTITYGGNVVGQWDSNGIVTAAPTPAATVPAPTVTTPRPSLATTAQATTPPATTTQPTTAPAYQPSSSGNLPTASGMDNPENYNQFRNMSLAQFADLYPQTSFEPEQYRRTALSRIGQIAEDITNKTLGGLARKGQINSTIGRDIMSRNVGEYLTGALSGLEQAILQEKQNYDQRAWQNRNAQLSAYNAARNAEIAQEVAQGTFRANYDTPVQSVSFNGNTYSVGDDGQFYDVNGNRTGYYQGAGNTILFNGNVVGRYDSRGMVTPWP